MSKEISTDQEKEAAVGAIFSLVRNSKLFGTGSCSTYDECYADADLREEVVEGVERRQSAEEIIDFMITVENVWWEREGLYNWREDHKDAIAEIKAQAKAIK